MQCTPCWLLICQDQSTGYAATCFTHTPEMIIPLVYCLKGEVINELKDGSKSTLTEGMSYIVSDELSSHRSITEKGCTLLIIDGDFLQLKQ